MRGAEPSLKLSCKLSNFLCAAALLCASAPVTATPNTFGSVIGQGLLCLSELDAGYFYNYLTQSFGPPYKHEGNAYWFRVQGALWGAPISEILVSDADSPQRFLAAVADVAPEVLVGKITDTLHIRFTPTTQYVNPVRVSQAGSKIIYYNRKSKIYCAIARALSPG
ncbi:MAG: hypothetical protein JWP38_1932 [Herbaspirillum sp.]|nr:hypothetical protein [Herbaspirillum sp.]